MLIELSVENFLSFKEKTTFSMVANPSKEYPEYYTSEHDIEISNGMTVLPLMAIYGANASGKSNLIKALGKIVSIAQGRSITPPNTDKYFFLFDEYLKDKPSTLSLKFYIKKTDKIYIYKVEFDSNKIFQETLQELKDDDTPIVIYTRILLKNKIDLIGKGYKSINTSFYQYQFNNSVFNKHSSILLEVETLNRITMNRSFIGNIIPSSKTSIVNIIIFFRNISITFPKDSNTQHLEKIFNAYLNNDSDTNKVKEFIKHFDLDIDDTNVKDIPFDSLDEEIVKRIKSDIDAERANLENEFTKFKNKIEKNKKYINSRNEILETGIPVGTLNGEYIIFFNPESDNNSSITCKKISYFTREVELSNRQVSDGTKRLLDFMSLLNEKYDASNESTIFIIDEMDSRLHPQLMKHLLSNFVKLNNSKNYKKNNYTHQLIFTTHDTGLIPGSIDLDSPLRPDEISITLKDKELSSSIRNFSQYKGIEKMAKSDLRSIYLAGFLYGVPDNMKNFVDNSDTDVKYTKDTLVQNSEHSTK